MAYNDPNPYPRPLYESLAWGYVQAKRYAEAEATLREGLKREPNNGFAFALLAEALTAARSLSSAGAALAQMRRAWRHADPDLPALRRAQALAGAAKNWSPTPPPRMADREALGPASWRPFPAPDVALRDPAGKSVPLSSLRGRSVVLVFYLGAECKHCVEQLAGLGKEKAAFEALGASLAAASIDTPEANRAFLEANPDYPIRLLSDAKSEAARRFAAYDEFENRDLHATVLLDKDGRVWWFRSGSAPFTDWAFLKAETARMNAAVERGRVRQPVSTRAPR